MITALWFHGKNLIQAGQGNKISKEFTEPAPISDCQPIVKGSKIVYYASNANMVNFYSIDTETGAFSKFVDRVYLDL